MAALVGVNGARIQMSDGMPTSQDPLPKRGPNRSADKEYKRAYKACILCRKTKARCEIQQNEDGSLSQGPCGKDFD
jgi:hypothetical protein